MRSADAPNTRTEDLAKKWNLSRSDLRKYIYETPMGAKIWEDYAWLRANLSLTAVESVPFRAAKRQFYLGEFQ